MSASEIADNKWELEASRPPVKSLGAIAQIAVVGSFALIFGWILTFSLMGIFGSKKESLADRYGEMTADGKAAPAAGE
ncbi:MAG: hypothetical protein R3A51_13465 [Nannocystaceae bacterium]